MSSTLWTPGTTERPANGLQIWTPSSAEEKRRVYRCNVCGKSWPAPSQRQQWARHVTACAKKNEDTIERIVHLKRNSDYVLGIADEERSRFVRKRKAKGRLKKSDVYDSK